MDYEQGLKTLKERAKYAHWYQEALLYEARLRSNLREEQHYGPAQQTSQERMRVVDQLNRLCWQHLEVSFNDLCLSSVSSPASQPTQLIRSLGAVVCFYSGDERLFYHQ